MAKIGNDDGFKKYVSFKKFDTVVDHSDHLFTQNNIQRCSRQAIVFVFSFNFVNISCSCHLFINLLIIIQIDITCIKTKELS